MAMPCLTHMGRAEPRRFRMRSPRFRYSAPLLLGLMAASTSPVRMPAAAEQHLLYVASPGTRNYVQYGGVGILVFDIENGYKFVRRIPTWSVPDGKEPEN